MLSAEPGDVVVSSGQYDILDFAASVQNLQSSFIQYSTNPVPRVVFPFEGDVNITVMVYGVADRNKPNRNVVVRFNRQTMDDFIVYNEYPPETFYFFPDYDSCYHDAPTSCIPRTPTALQTPAILSFWRHVYPGDYFIVGVARSEYEGTPVATFERSQLMVRFKELGMMMMMML